jgi:hypothetical protein
MSRGALKDLKALLERCTSTDSYGVEGSDFAICHICHHESGAGVLWRQHWHAKDCPVPRLTRKYEHRGQQERASHEQ